MLCGNCGKREVEVLVKQVVKGEVLDINLCRICAEELGFLSSQQPSITISFSMHEVDAPRRRKVIRLQSKIGDEKHDGLTCPECGMTYHEYKSGGVLGCAGCYQAFRFPLGAKLQSIQGAESHWVGTSKIFSEIGVLNEEDVLVEAKARHTEGQREASIKRLNEEMKDAVSREEYERAAKLRDLLRPLLMDEEPLC